MGTIEFSDQRRRLNIIRLARFDTTINNTSVLFQGVYVAGGLFALDRFVTVFTIEKNKE